MYTSLNCGYWPALALATLAALAGCGQRSEPGREPAEQPQHAGMNLMEYGSWPSPISAEKVFAGANSVHALRAVAEDLYWIEYRANENGRYAVMRLSGDGDSEVLTPDGFNARTKVHEYGGGAMAVAGDHVYFSDFDSQRLYRQPRDGAGEPIALTPASQGALRYADCTVDDARNRLICVREDHRVAGEPANTLVAIDATAGGEGRVLFDGTDFVAAPTLSPDGERLAWRAWNHPNMPWDEMHVYVADIDDGGELSNVRAVAAERGGSQTQPQFAPDGTLYFVADWTNWWNVYRLTDAGPQPVHRKDAEFVSPDWGLGNRAYAFLDARTAVVSYTQSGRWHLARLDVASGELSPLGEDFADIDQVVRAGDAVYFVGATATDGEAIYRTDGTAAPSVVYRPAGPELDGRYISVPEAVDFPTGNGQQAHGFFYPPVNPDVEALGDATPPLIVELHGGPTAATTAELDPAVQFWTSRGFAVLDLNYRGSTGYGREYRRSLYGKWGVYDLEDAVNGASWLAEQGRADGRRLAIRGGSAGGFTTLAALAFKDSFAAGTSYYGVSDLEALTTETHKFESRYLDQIVGPYPDKRERYHRRSPIHAIDAIDAPLLIFQGLDDKVVPPNQAEAIYEGLKARGVPVAYVAFEGEGHGFRKPANRIRSLSLELGFYGLIFGFEPAGDVPNPELDNWPPSGSE